MKKHLLCIVALLLLFVSGAQSLWAQLTELDGYGMSVSSEAATSLTTGQWYVMYNRGRKAYAYETDSKGLYCTDTAPGSDVHAYLADNCRYLVRLVASSTDGQYYLQTGYGNYFGTLTSGSNNGATTSQTQAYTYGTIASTAGHFYLQAVSSYILDCNERGGTIAGWGTTVPSTANGNNDWAFFPVTLTEGKYYPVGLYRLESNRTSGYYMTNENGSLYARTADAESKAQMWLIDKSDDGYTFRSLSTGEFIQKQTNLNTVLTTGSTKQVFYVKVSDAGKKIAVSYNSDLSGTTCFHDDARHNIVNWSTDADATWWTFSKVDTYTDAEIKEMLSECRGSVSAVAADKYYRIHNQKYGTLMQEGVSRGTATCSAKDTTDYTQLWTLEGSGTSWALKNAVTGRYLQTKGGSASSQYTTGSTAYKFTLSETGDKWLYNFYIKDTGSVVLHCDASSNVVGWYTNAEASEWYFEEVTLTEAEQATLKEKVQAFQDYNASASNASAYNTTLQKYFTTTACTALTDTYASKSDDELKEAMATDNLPDALQAIVLKVKNNTWTTYDENWDHTEKTFRVADYKAYANGGYGNDGWATVIGHDYCYAQLTNPTGIAVSKGDLLEVFVGDVPDGESVKLEIVAQRNATGTQYALSEGLNYVLSDIDGNCFVNYTVKNITGTDYYGETLPFKKMSEYPDVTVHIEGGTVNGYFDLTKGDDNSDWAYLQKYLLTANPACNMKTEKLCFNVSKEEAVKNCPTNLTQLLTDWDSLQVWEEELEGIDEYKDYFNCMLSVTGINYNYMFATSYGTYYHEETFNSVFNADNMHTSGASLWGPAHENGHVRQGLINTAGMTEVSNNLFSNMAVYRQGYNTSRAAAITTTFNGLAAGTPWLKRGIWEQTHMYYQLYLFFQVQGYDADFYPNLFRALRRDRLNKSHSTFVPVTQDYLKFYEKACEVSGYDLTEFFQAYGFFEIPELSTVTLSGEARSDVYHVNDYGDTYLTFSQDSINISKARVAAMNLKSANPIFIEDRITAPAATYEGAAEGTTRTAFSDEDSNKIGTHGTMGQYTDYDPDIKPTGYAYTLSESGTVTLTDGTGAVGIKVYDTDGNLVYLANSTTFTLPDSIRTAGFTIKAAGADGTDVEIPLLQTVSVTFEVSDTEGNVVKTFSKDYRTGTTITAYPDEMNAYEFVAYTPETPNVDVTTDMEKVKVTYTFTGPFTPSTADDPHYYYIKVRGAYVNYNTVNEYNNVMTATPAATANSQWAFWGNPYEGFALTNRKLGSETYFAPSEAANGSSLTTSDTKYLWEVKNLSKVDTIALKTSTGSFYWNRFGGIEATVMKFWSGVDAGSYVVIEEADDPTEYSGYYRIQNHNAQTRYASLNVSGGTVTAPVVETTSPTTIFRMEEQEDGRVIFSSHGQYLKAYADGAQSTSANADDAYHAMILKGYNGDGARVVVFSGTDGKGQSYWHTNASDAIVLWNANAGGSHWLITPVTKFEVAVHAVGDKAYATAYLPFAFTLPEGATANAITVSGTTATAVPFDTVPEGTGVLLINNASASALTLKVVTPTETTASDANAADVNRLAGVYVNTAVSGSPYTFSAGSSGTVPGFYKYSGSTLNAYRSYLPADVADGIRGFILDTSTVGISTLDAASGSNAATYDLQGRRVKKAAKGIYIQDGKKVLMR